jgi:hypothetical protein
VVEAIQGLVVIFIAAGLAIKYNETVWARLLRGRKELGTRLEKINNPEKAQD